MWLDDETREALRSVQRAFGTASVNSTIRRLIRQPAPDARTLFAQHRKTIESILRQHKLRGLVAFGSRARGDARATSDFDLAVEVSSTADPLAVLAAEADFEEEFGIPVNLVELPNARLGDVIRREGVAFEPG